MHTLLMGVRGGQRLCEWKNRTRYRVKVRNHLFLLSFSEAQCYERPDVFVARESEIYELPIQLLLTNELSRGICGKL